MGRHDWYRNLDWNPEIETQFFEKLRRARDKSQYLRIQACLLTKSKPETALDLLERYFALGVHFDRAQAYVDQAEAFLSLGEIERALISYEHALAREKEYPNLLTQAYVELPLLVAMMERRERYDLATEIPDNSRSRPMFPAERFKWHAAHALISVARGDDGAAARYAAAALADASASASGFQYHPRVGLVGSAYSDLRLHLAKLAAGDGHPSV
jgi:tetratricopeptide (TPR) repeat protein